MSINTRPTVFPFDELMEHFEGWVDLPYDDGQHIATVGIGTNIKNNRQYLALVLRELGVFAASDATVTGTETEAQRDARYQKIIDGFVSVIGSVNLQRQPSEGPGRVHRRRLCRQSSTPS